MVISWPNKSSITYSSCQLTDSSKFLSDQKQKEGKKQARRERERAKKKTNKNLKKERRHFQRRNHRCLAACVFSCSKWANEPPISHSAHIYHIFMLFFRQIFMTTKCYEESNAREPHSTTSKTTEKKNNKKNGRSLSSYKMFNFENSRNRTTEKQ